MKGSQSVIKQRLKLVMIAKVASRCANCTRIYHGRWISHSAMVAPKINSASSIWTRYPLHLRLEVKYPTLKRNRLFHTKKEDCHRRLSLRSQLYRFIKSRLRWIPRCYRQLLKSIIRKLSMKHINR